MLRTLYHPASLASRRLLCGSITSITRSTGVRVAGIHVYSPGHPNPTEADREEAIRDMRKETIIADDQYLHEPGRPVRHRIVQLEPGAVHTTTAGRASDITDALMMRDLQREGASKQELEEERDIMDEARKPYDERGMEEVRKPYEG